MNALQPLSEDFLYWNPEDIYQYPQENGVEDHWFIRDSGKKMSSMNEHTDREVSNEQSS